jgi:hypothetical protein
VGDVIPAARWGQIVQSRGSIHPFFYREALFEQIRSTDFPKSPSRLASNFAWENRDTAEGMAHEGHHLYKVGMPQGARIARVDATWCSLVWNSHAVADAFDMMKHYWRGERVRGLARVQRSLEYSFENGVQTAQLMGHYDEPSATELLIEDDLEVLEVC